MDGGLRMNHGGAKMSQFLSNSRCLSAICSRYTFAKPRIFLYQTLTRKQTTLLQEIFLYSNVSIRFS